MQSPGTMPQQVFFLLRQVVIRTMDREVVFLTLRDKFFQPLSHHLAFPANYRPLIERQALIRHDQVLVYSEHFPESFTNGTSTQRIVETEHHIRRLDKSDTVRLELLGVFLYNRLFSGIDTDDTGIVSLKESRFRRISQTAFQRLIVRNDQAVYQQFDDRGSQQRLVRHHFRNAVSRIFYR